MPLFLTKQIISTETVPGDNIVMNPGFEEGVRSHWTIQTACEAQESANAVQGDNACRVSSRMQPWSSVAQEIRSGILIWGPGQYLISAYVKIDGDTASDQMLVVLNTHYDYTQRWFTASATINNQSYTKIEGIINIPYTVDVASCLLYLQSSAGALYDFICDDFSVRKLNGIREPIPIPTSAPPEPIKERPEKTLIGAIRWDAWLNPELPTFNLSPSEKHNYIGAQMVRSLSPQQYHFRLPYFGIVLDADSVTFPDYSQEIFDEEMRYAIETGIDYFMYCWYENGSGMDMARRFHETSPYRNQVKMSAMWDISSIPTATLDTHMLYLKQDYWQKVDGGRPLVYVNRGNFQTVLGVKRFRKACIDAGLQNPYLVGIRNFGSTPQNIKEYGLDALSDYAVGGGGANPFSYLMNLNMDRWYYDTISGVQYIPLVTTGWDRRPRIDHPVTWEGPTADKNAYIQTATPEEIATLLQKALDFNQTHKEQTGINSVLIYAWNEHDEGGWLCPTIVDTNRDGLPELDKDGNYLRDTARLKAIQQVR
jgi:hypothetical protein